jgi:O-methyltransferase
MKYKEDFVSEIVSFYKNQLALIRNIKLSKNITNVTHQHIISYSTYSPWYDDEIFLKTYNAIKKNTLVDIYRCFELWTFIKRNARIQGDILEVGVWRGGTGCLMAKAVQQFSGGNVFLADTFSGVVKASDADTVYQGGEHADTSIEIVETLIQELALDNVKILKGIFPDQIKFDPQPPIRLCHIDVDTYSSAKDIFNYIWPHITKGGAVIFDDYGFWGCEGITRLCNEILLPDATFIHNINGHCIFIKI